MGCVVSIEVIRMVEGTLLPMAEHNRDLERQVMCLRQKADYLRDFGSWTRAAENLFFFGGTRRGVWPNIPRHLMWLIHLWDFLKDHSYHSRSYQGTFPQSKLLPLSPAWSFYSNVATLVVYGGKSWWGLATFQARVCHTWLFFWEGAGRITVTDCCLPFRVRIYIYTYTHIHW